MPETASRGYKASRTRETSGLSARAATTHSPIPLRVRHVIAGCFPTVGPYLVIICSEQTRPKYRPLNKASYYSAHLFSACIDIRNVVHIKSRGSLVSGTGLEVQAAGACSDRSVPYRIESGRRPARYQCLRPGLISASCIPHMYTHLTNLLWHLWLTASLLLTIRCDSSTFCTQLDRE